VSEEVRLVEGANLAEWLTVDQAAAEVGISPRTIRKYLSQPAWSGSARSEQRETRSGWRVTRFVTRATARRMARAARYLEPETEDVCEPGQKIELGEGAERRVVATLKVKLYG
jgi:predicted ArsR family transcriptional regulator